MDNAKDKKREKDGDGQQAIATEDIKDRDKTQSIHHERHTLKTPTKSKAKANGETVAKKKTTKEKEREVKGSRFKVIVGIKLARKNPK